MASGNNKHSISPIFYETLKPFPVIINGRINMFDFLEAAQDCVRVVVHLGKVFTPVKNDLQGNIDNIKKYSKYDENSCLLDVIETYRGTPVIPSVIWLNRGLLFYELLNNELITVLQGNDLNVSPKKIYTAAYEGSVKKYHNWATQQIFSVICRMGPSIPQILKAIEADTNLKAFETVLNTMTIKLHLVRSKIDEYLNEKFIFVDS